MRPSALFAIAAAMLLSPAVTHAADESTPKPDADGFYSLFNGKNLDGWKFSEKPGTFKVEDGNIVVNGPRSHLFYEGPVNNHDFKNFHFKCEVMTFPQANSGIYFHTKYQDTGFPSQGFECQVNETHKDPKKTGGLYAIKDVMNTPPAKDNEWFTYEIIVEGKHVVIKINGKTTTDWTQPDDYQPPKNMAGRFIQHGTFALQGHDPGSKVLFRNIMVKPLPD